MLHERWWRPSCCNQMWRLDRGFKDAPRMRQTDAIAEMNASAVVHESDAGVIETASSTNHVAILSPAWCSKTQTIMGLWRLGSCKILLCKHWLQLVMGGWLGCQLMLYAASSTLGNNTYFLQECLEVFGHQQIAPWEILWNAHSGLKRLYSVTYAPWCPSSRGNWLRTFWKCIHMPRNIPKRRLIYGGMCLPC